ARRVCACWRRASWYSSPVLSAQTWTTCLKSLALVITSLPWRQPPCAGDDDSRSEVSTGQRVRPPAPPERSAGVERDEGVAMTVAVVILFARWPAVTGTSAPNAPPWRPTPRRLPAVAGW